MTRFQSCKAGRISRKRQTPLSSSAFQEVRRCNQSSLRPAASSPAARVTPFVFQPGKTTSNRSPHCAQRTLLAPSSPTAPHAIQRNCDTPVSNLDANAAWSVTLLAYGMDESLVSTQVLISLVNPVGARRIEYIEVNRVVQGFRLVRHVRRDGQNFAGIHHDLLAVDPELERALQHICELLIVMAMQWDDAALLHQDARDDDGLTDNNLALQQRLQVFQFDGMPGNVFQFHFAGAVFRRCLKASALRSGGFFATDFTFAFAIAAHLSRSIRRVRPAYEKLAGRGNRRGEIRRYETFVTNPYRTHRPRARFGR